MAGINTVTFTDGAWDAEVLQSDKPVLVDFWAEWCGPCRMMSPTIDALADDYSGRVTIGKLNVDENDAAAMRYGVRGIPTLLLFKGGQEVARKVGATSKTELQQLIDSNL
ncbi:MAG: thioredoxin [Bryobacterales bacterium]|nr:thioredoxin [Bryobacterales bacterium]